MNLSELPASMHAPLDPWQQAHLQEHVERLPTSTALPWFITLLGWHVGITARAATALRVLDTAGIDFEHAALIVARQLRGEVRNLYDRLYAANRTNTYPSPADHHDEQQHLDLAHRLGLFIDWLTMQGIR